MRHLRWAWTMVAWMGCTQSVDLAWKFESPWGSVSTPLVTPDFIAFGGEGGVTLLEPGGAVRCVFESSGEVVSAPRSDGQRIYFGSTNYMFYAITPDCKLAWKHPTRDRIKSDAFVMPGKVITSSYDGHVYALNPTDGAVLWTFPAPDITSAEKTSAAPDKKPPGKAAKKHRRPKRGPSKKRRELAAPDDHTPASPPAKAVVVGDFSYSSPVVDGGVVYVGNLDNHLYALDAATGAMRWRHLTMGPVTSTPVVHEGVIYFGSNDGSVYALRVADQKVVWQHKTQEWINSSPRIVGDTLYVGGNDRHVYALDLATGKVHWKFGTKGPIVATPAVYKNFIIVAGGSGDGAVYAIDVTTQKLAWSFQSDGKIESDPVIVDKTLYVTCTDHHTYAFKLDKLGSS